MASDGATLGGGTVLECYSAEHKLVWRRAAPTFFDLPSADALDPSDLFTKEKRFTLNYGKPPGSEWSYRAFTIDPYRFPGDPRLHIPAENVWVRTLHGRRFLFMTGMTGEFLEVFRFEPGAETAIPCALFSKWHTTHFGGYPPQQPAQGE